MFETIDEPWQMGPQWLQDFATPIVHGLYRKIPCKDLRNKFIDDLEVHEVDSPAVNKAKKKEDKDEGLE